MNDGTPESPNWMQRKLAARAEPPAAFDAASKKREMETQAQIEDAAETLRAVAEPPAEAERPCSHKGKLGLGESKDGFMEYRCMDCGELLREPPAPPRLSGQPSESGRGEPQEGRGPCAYCGKPTVNAMFLIGEGTQVWHLHCRDLAAAPSPAQPAEEGGSADGPKYHPTAVAVMLTEKIRKHLEHCLRTIKGVDCPDLINIVHEWALKIAHDPAPSPPASAREREEKLIGDAAARVRRGLRQGGYLNSHWLPLDAVDCDVETVVRNAMRDVLARAALETERGEPE